MNSDCHRIIAQVSGRWEIETTCWLTRDNKDLIEILWECPMVHSWITLDAWKWWTWNVFDKQPHHARYLDLWEMQIIGSEICIQSMRHQNLYPQEVTQLGLNAESEITRQRRGFYETSTISSLVPSRNVDYIRKTAIWHDKSKAFIKHFDWRNRQPLPYHHPHRFYTHFKHNHRFQPSRDQQFNNQTTITFNQN